MRSATRVLFVLAALGGVSAGCSSSPSTSTWGMPDGGSSGSGSGSSSGGSSGSSGGSGSSSSGGNDTPDSSVSTNEDGSTGTNPDATPGTGSDAAGAGVDAALPGWTLTWSDEFDTPDGTQPNPMYWNYDLGDGTAAGAPGWGNNELESYTSSTDNVVIQGGNLVITAKVNTDSTLTCATCPDSGNGACTYKMCGYTSGRIHTQGKFSQTYGRFEARIKIPSGSGVWPAFWMMGEQFTQDNWPQYGEIDVMENAGSMPAEISGTIHGPGGSATYTDDGLTKAYDLTSGNFSDDFHVFAMEWDVGTITFFVDGNMYFTVTSADVTAVGGGATWPFDNNPNFVLLNFAVDSGNFGDPPNSMTKWPQQMLVDYVRVYKKQ